MWGTPGGTRGDPWHCSRSHGTVLECLPSHMRGSNTGSQIDDAAGRSMWGSPACLVQGSDSDPVHVQQHPQALNGASTANYAAALRSATQPGNSVNANSRPHSPTGAAALTNDAIYAHLDTCGREVHSLLPPTAIDAVCDAVRRAAPRLNAPALLQVCKLTLSLQLDAYASTKLSHAFMKSPFRCVGRFGGCARKSSKLCANLCPGFPLLSLTRFCLILQLKQ